MYGGKEALVIPDSIAKLAIDSVQRHVDEQPNTDIVEMILLYERQARIEHNGEKSVQRMKANTATAGIVDRVSQQMININ